jgi:hypothetical protein
MAGGSKGAARTIAQFLEAKLPDAVAATAKGAGRAPAPKTRVVRPGNMTAPELREFMLTPRGQRSLTSDTVKPGVHQKNSELLGKQNRLWQAQYEQMVFGKVETPEAAKGFDPKRDALPSPAREEGPDRVGGNSLYDRPDEAKRALADKAEFEAKSGQREDISRTRTSLEGVTAGRRRAETPLGESTNRRDRRNPGTEEAEAEDIGPVLERGTTAWRSRSEPAGSEVVAGGGDGSKPLPVAQRAAEAPQTKREVVDRDEEIDPNSGKKSTRQQIPVLMPDGSTITPGSMERRSRNQRAVTSVGGTSASPYLNKMVTDIVGQLRNSKYSAPYDFTYTINVKEGKKTVTKQVPVKKGDELDNTGIRHLMSNDPKLFENFVGKTKYRNAGPKDDLTDADARKAAAIGASGVDPVQPEVGARLDRDEIEASEVAKANITRMEGRPTQPATARINQVRNSVIKEFGIDEYKRVIDSIKADKDGRFAYSLAYRTAESAMKSAVPGERVSAVMDSDSIHGYAAALMADAGRPIPTNLPASVQARDAAAIADSAARPGLGSRPPARPGSETRWSEAEEGFVAAPSDTRTFLRGNARARPFKPDAYPDLPKAGAPGKDDGIVLSEPKDVTRAPQKEYRGTVGGKSVDQLIADYDAGTLAKGDPGYDAIADVIREREATTRDFKDWGSGADVGPVRAFDQKKPEVNPSLRRVSDPLTPDTKVDRGLKDLQPTWALGDEDALPIQGRGARRGGKKAAPPTPVEPTGGDDLADVSETELAAGMPGRQRKAASGEGDEASRRAAVRAGWSAEERAARKVDPNVAASELADDLSDYSTGQPTDAELQAIEAERAETAATKARRPVASDTVVNEGGTGSAPPPTAPPTSTVAATAPRTTATRPSQPPPQVVDVGAAAARRRAQAAATSTRPIEQWQADAIDAPRAGSVTRVNEGSPEALPDMHDLRVHGDPTAAIRAAQQRRRSGARGHDTGWGTTFEAPPFREGPLPAPSGNAFPDAPQGDIDPSDFADADNPFYVPIDDTPGSGLDGADIVDDVSSAPGVSPKNPWASTAGMRAEYRGKTPQSLDPPPTATRQAIDATLGRVRQAAGSNYVRVPAAAAAALVGYRHASNAIWPPAPPVGVPDFGDDQGAVAPVSAPMPGDEAALLQSIREMRLREMRRPAGGASRIGYPGTMYQD